MFKKIKFWVIDVARGYSATMSLLNWLVIFAFTLSANSNVLYGVLSLFGILFCQLGANLFDDYIDHKSGTPKQECKTFYLTEGLVTINTVLLMALGYFGAASLIGLFLIIKCGFFVLVLAAIGSFICLIYPKLNYFGLGELAVGSAFGPLMFLGIYFVMTSNVSFSVFLLSLPIALMTILLLDAHALMDYDFDKINGKKTICILAGSKINALKIIMMMILLAYFILILLVFLHIVPTSALITIIIAPYILKFYKSMKIYINTTTPSKDAFMVNFKLARNIAALFSLILSAVFFLCK